MSWNPALLGVPGDRRHELYRVPVRVSYGENATPRLIPKKTLEVISFLDLNGRKGRLRNFVYRLKS